MTAFVVVVVVALLLPLLLIKRETDDDESVRIFKVLLKSCFLWEIPQLKCSKHIIFVQHNSSFSSRLSGRKRVLLAEKEAPGFGGRVLRLLLLLLCLPMTMKTMRLRMMENKEDGSRISTDWSNKTRGCFLSRKKTKKRKA